MVHSWPVFGHDWAVDYIQKGMVHDRIRHAYLITGTSSIGKMRFAQSFAMALNCLHDDVLARPCMECRPCKRLISGNHIDTIYSESDANTGALKIDAIRSVTNQLSMKPYESRYRIAILDGFDNAQPRAQDSLLKTLEEPSPHAILILLATSLEPVLATITSRSQIIYLRPVETNIIQTVLMEDHGVEEGDATLLARLSGGRIGWAIDAAKDPDVLDQRSIALDMLEETLSLNRAGRFDMADKLGRDKIALNQLLSLWQTYWRDVLLQVEGAPIKPANIDRTDTMEHITREITPEEAREALRATRTMMDNLRWNLNVRLGLEVMFLDYPGLSR